MGISDIRKPIQKRSIETKEKILKAGFELICEKGYHNTNTAEIAKAANVSTGIVYQYFKDKHDILIESIQIYGISILSPMIEILDKEFSSSDLDVVLKKIIKSLIKSHTISRSAHNEIMALALSDDQVGKIFQDSEIQLTNKIIDILIKNGLEFDNMREKVHIIINLADDLCHEVVYHKHESIDYDAMIDVAVECIKNLLK
ncbi:MAG: TetR/AcrR family transcriptional regulator [Clostridia bacterium]|nr:TetR/AcrR family transcriptional regulator [Clostridia bacterium]